VTSWFWVSCTERSTSAQAKEEPLGSGVDYESALLALVNSLNKIELHTQQCEKCKKRINHQEAWILDSGASQHFTSTKVDFIDYEVIKNAPEVHTASAKVLKDMAKSLCRE
jgi:histidyl-tRNA synthetase